MKNIFKNWSVMRAMRLAMALFIIYQGIQLQHVLFVGAGVLFAILPLLNIGCCGTLQCNTIRYNNPKKNNKPTTFTEIK